MKNFKKSLVIYAVILMICGFVVVKKTTAEEVLTINTEAQTDVTNTNVLIPRGLKKETDLTKPMKKALYIESQGYLYETLGYRWIDGKDCVVTDENITICGTFSIRSK
jgi:hypothetical protein